MHASTLQSAQPGARSSAHSTLRTIGAVIVGLLTWILVATILNFPLRVWWPNYHQAETAFDFALGMKLARLALGAISSVSSGFVTAWLAKGHTVAAQILGIVLLALFIPNHYLLWDKFPVWYHLMFLISLFPLTWLGALLNRPTR